MPDIDRAGPEEMPVPRTPLFKIGDTPRSMRVVKITKRATIARHVRYLVEAVICGHRYEVTHKTLRDTRRAKHPGLCKKCLRMEMKKIKGLIEQQASLAPKQTKLSYERQVALELQQEFQWAMALWSPPAMNKAFPHHPSLNLVNRLTIS